MNSAQRKEAYACDITYVTNNELGFDYLRDNMAIYKEQLVLRDLDYCIIDEVDSVLIDEARTPLIISGQSGKSPSLYEACDILARQLKRFMRSAMYWPVSWSAERFLRNFPRLMPLWVRRLRRPAIS